MHESDEQRSGIELHCVKSAQARICESAGENRKRRLKWKK